MALVKEKLSFLSLFTFHHLTMLISVRMYWRTVSTPWKLMTVWSKRERNRDRNGWHLCRGLSPSILGRLSSLCQESWLNEWDRGGNVISLSHNTNSGCDLIKWIEKDDDQDQDSVNIQQWCVSYTSGKTAFVSNRVRAKIRIVLKKIKSIKGRTKSTF